MFRLDLSDGGNIDKGREVGTSWPSDLRLTRCIAIVNSSRFMNPSRSKVVSPLLEKNIYFAKRARKERGRRKNPPDPFQICGRHPVDGNELVECFSVEITHAVSV